MNFTSKNKLFITFLVLFLFLFMRLFRLPQTLEFYSDIGRDHLVLLNWKQTGKPPLLGPSTSMLPLNQSPWYFYIMYPFFLASNASPYTSIATVLACYSILYLTLVYVYRNNQQAVQLLWGVFFIISIHSLFVEQHRSPWNPSFVTPFILVSLCALMFPEGNVKKRILAITLGLAFAVGMSYSVAPTAGIIFVAACIRFRRHLLWLFAINGASSLLVFSPLIVSEIKHNFFFFHQLIIEKSGQFASNQDFIVKARELLMFVLWGRLGDFKLVFFPIVILCIAYVLSNNVQSRKLFYLLTVATILTLFLPFALHSHYVYGIATVLLCFIATLPKRYILIFSIALLPQWFSSDAMGSTLYRPIRRSVDDLAACAKIVCDAEKDPIYVTDAAWHDYHYAPDHLFFMNKAGCQAKDITSNPGYAKRMAVVVDQGSYTYGKTSFNELTLFDPAQLVHYYACPGNIQVVMLEKIE